MTPTDQYDMTLSLALELLLWLLLLLLLSSSANKLGHPVANINWSAFASRRSQMAFLITFCMMPALMSETSPITEKRAQVNLM